MKRAVCTMALFLSSFAGSAQAPKPAQSAELQTSKATSTCPIAMRARQAFLTQRDLVNHDLSPNGKDRMAMRRQGMQMRLTLQGDDRRHIATADVTVTGLKGDGQQMKLMSAERAGNSGTIMKTIDISFEAGDDGTVDAYFTAPGFSMVKTIKLNTVTYANGSTWKMPDANACSVAPEGLMLIADR
jgi:hypothetical protein